MSEQENLTQLALEGGTYETRVTTKFTKRKTFEKQDPRVIKSVIPGVAAVIHTTVGAQVKRGDTLMIQEAMKMNNRIKAPVDGTVKAILVAAGEKVVKGQILLELE